MTSLALAPCFSALRFLFAIGKALNLVVTGIEARYRACAQLQPDELWRHSFSYGDNKFLMATIKVLWRISIFLWRISDRLWRKSHRAMAKITSRHGDIIPIWRKLSGGRSPMAGADALLRRALGSQRILKGQF